MRLMRAIGLVTVVGLALGLLPVPPGAAQVKIPPDVALEKAKDTPGEVVFSHDKHKAKVEKCAACHTKVFKLKKGTTGVATMDQMKAGQQCGACHKRATAPHDERLPAVNCAECHAEARAPLGEGAHGSRRAQARAPAPTCVGCHDTGYLAFVDEWTAGFDKEATRAAAALKQAQDALRAARRKGRVPPGADLLVKEARDAFLLVKGARAVHNPPAAEALLEVARRKAEEALAEATRR